MPSQQMKHFDVKQEQHKCSILRQWIHFVENEQFPRKQEFPFIPESFQKEYRQLSEVE